MDSCIGLDYIVENPDYVEKLATALDTSNAVVKKQVFELLSALCVYSPEGHLRALDALDTYKELKGERYRFRIIVTELSEATAVDYQKALVAFINCVINSTAQLKDRIKIRNDFIGLKLLPALNDIRRRGVTAPELVVQLDVFEEQREADEAQLLQGPHGVDLSSHLDVFYSILRQVADTPQEIPFLSILQHLLRIDPKEAISDIVWDTAETLVHRATLLENRQDATRLLRSPSIQGKLNCHCNCHGYRCGSDGSRKQSLITSTTATSPPPPPLPAAPPPPPLPPPGLVAPPPPPPPPLAPPRSPSQGPPSGGNMGGPPMPPPLLHSKAVPGQGADVVDSTNAKLLPQQEIPTPKAKMKTINWNKIPNHKVVGKHNIWSLVARSHQNSEPQLDWAEMEGLFCQQTPASLPPLTASPRLGRDLSDADRKRKESSEIALLDGKRSLNVNIFLKQFRSCNEDIIQLIRDGEHDDIGAEKLRGLLKLLPEIDELEMLKAFDGDVSKLGNAEKFLLQLIQVPNYKLRIESMLLKEEFAANMGYLEPSINAMIVAGEDLTTNKQLQELLYMVVVAGNFLNFGGYAGNAAGVKLSSLQKLTDIRANKPGMNLIHYVAMQAEKKRKDLLTFAEDLSALEDATKTTVEQLQNEINILDTRIKKVRKQVELPTTEKEIKSQVVEFLNMAEQEVAGLQKDMEELEAVRLSLAEFFCEDPGTFKLEDCFKVFHGFCVKFRQAVQENERRKVQEEQTMMRRKLREEQAAAKKRQLSTASSEMDCSPVDGLLFGMNQRKGPDRDAKVRRFQSGMTSEEEASPGLPRRRMGSFSGPPGEEPQETFSPDVTPTGSLRRRRSRVPSEEDDSNLMDFLRASGQDVGRERKSWGSLDRSWARRARGGARKRPDLLSADFGGERERPTSPSPLAEDKTILQPAEPEEKPKAWKQKIEAWLKENEREENQNTKVEELRRRNRRIQSINRRSLEADSESESRNGTLDTLPEERISRTNESASDYKRVYSDWKPAIEKTDVVGAMEAIEEAQPQAPNKDKSVWRKSNLNLADGEKDEDPRKLRRLRSRNSMEKITPSSLKSIQEEEKRKGIISVLSQTPAEDKLTLYLRRPSGEEVPLVRGGSLRLPKRTSEPPLLPPSVPRRLQRQDEAISDKIEIDSDNIETPPATRRKFTKLRDLSSSLEDEPRRSAESKLMDLPRTSPEGRSDKEVGERGSLLRNSQRLREIAMRGDQDEILGDGQFDRFSSARRTRRYKKSQDAETGDEKETEGPPLPSEIMTPELVSETQVLVTPTLAVHSEDVNKSDDKEARLKAWQTRLKYHGTPIQSEATRVAQEAITDINKIGSELKNIEAPTTKTSTFPRNAVLTSRKIPKKDDCVRKDRARSMIEPRQVSDALKSKSKRILGLKSSDPQNPSQQRSEFVPEIKIRALTPSHSKHREHELNDEGFEETQSLASETPSQGTSSGNFDSIESSVPENELDRKRNGKLDRADSSGSGDTNTSGSTNAPPKKLVKGQGNNAEGSTMNVILKRVKENTKLVTDGLDRSNSVKAPKTISADSKRTALHRTASLRKTDSQSSINSGKTINSLMKRRGVERSNSRTSLRSSRSSLNSATSVNTVKNGPSMTKSPSPSTPINKITSQRLAGYTSAIKNLTSNLEKETDKPKLLRMSSRDGTFGYKRPSSSEPKRPLSQVQLKSSTEKPRAGVPASRSSSSGSSIGPSARRPRLSPTLSNSFKENVSRVRSPTAAHSTSSIASDSKAKGGKTVIQIKYKENTAAPAPPTPSAQRSGLNFMKPTAASTAKDLETPVPKLRSVSKRFLK